jgi:hypothetical protein
VFEPFSSSHDIKFAISIDVNFREPFVFVGSAPGRIFPALFHFTVGAPFIDRFALPGLRLFWIRWYFRQEESRPHLIPENKFVFSITIKIAEH